MNKIFLIIITISIVSIALFSPESVALDETIAEEYAPIFYFENEETCFPVDISYHLDNSYLYQIGVETPISQSPTEEMIAGYTDSTYYLDNIKGTIQTDDIISDYQSSGYGYTIYARVITQGDQTYIQYWLFYAFNKGTINQHEGDWEMVQIVLTNDAPTQVMYSQHHSGQIATWEQTEKQGTHIKVYVSRGSHANYLRSYSGTIGIANDIVGANGKIISSSEYTLEMLDSQPWLEFGGLWGWSGQTIEEYQEAAFLGQTGPSGPKYREDGAMWNAAIWSNSLITANDTLFTLEFLLYNFVTIFVIIAALICGILFYRIYKRKQTRGLGPRKISILYIDGLNTKSIGNILCIIGIIVAIIALITPWYVISTDIGIEGYETDSMIHVLQVDGISGIQMQIPGNGGPIPLGAVMIPFSLLIGISIVFLIIATIGVAESKVLGKKYMFRGIRFMIPVVILLVFIFSLSMIPFESMVQGEETNVEIQQVVTAISNAPFGGQKNIVLQNGQGQIDLEWGLGIGGILLLLSGVLLIVAGMVERSADFDFFRRTSENN